MLWRKSEMDERRGRERCGGVGSVPRGKEGLGVMAIPRGLFGVLKSAMK